MHKNHSISTICFIDWWSLPTDAETGVLRIWAVPKEKPQESFRLKQVGFKTLCVLPSENKTTSNGSGKIKFTSRIACLFFDGGVGVYNLKNSSWDFLRDMVNKSTLFLLCIVFKYDWSFFFSIFICLVNQIKNYIFLFQFEYSKKIIIILFLCVNFYLQFEIEHITKNISHLYIISI